MGGAPRGGATCAWGARRDPRGAEKTQYEFPVTICQSRLWKTLLVFEKRKSAKFCKTNTKAARSVHTPRALFESAWSVPGARLL